MFRNFCEILMHGIDGIVPQEGAFSLEFYKQHKTLENLKLYWHFTIIFE